MHSDSVAGTASSSFEVATRLEPIGGGAFSAGVVHEYTVVDDRPNGGYLMALLGRAARLVAVAPGGVEGDGAGAAHDWEVVAASVTYLRPPDVGPAEVHTTELRRGRTAAHVRAVLVQDGVDCVDAVFVLSGLPEAGAPVRYDDTVALVAPPPSECIRATPVHGDIRVALMNVLELRFDPTTDPFSEVAAVDGTSAVAELRGWNRFVDGREPDPLSLLLFIDAIPPATFLIGSTGWVPTLQMSAYVRARPAPGWIGVRLTAHVVTGGMVDETTTLWDSTGRVVAQATQLARLRFPDEAR